MGKMKKRINHICVTAPAERTTWRGHIKEIKMPMTLWSEIVGYTCLDCGKWATHFYGNFPICCSCHAGEVDSFMESEAIKINSAFQKAGGIYLEEEE
jgi:hypothetical protein